MTVSQNPPAPLSALQDVALHDEIIAIKSSSEQQFYPVDKLQAHVDNIPHVAVSIFIFDDDKLLLQKRAATKYHSADLWANSVCSHPRWNESAAQCASRRLTEELGWAVPVKQFAEISYQAKVGELFENEHVHCFYGVHNKNNDIQQFNGIEVADVRWLTLAQIDELLHSNQDDFSAWFKIYMTQHRHLIEAIMQ